jgi:hypothetical protein
MIVGVTQLMQRLRSNRAHVARRVCTNDHFRALPPMRPESPAVRMVRCGSVNAYLEGDCYHSLAKKTIVFAPIDYFVAVCSPSMLRGASFEAQLT